MSSSTDATSSEAFVAQNTGTIVQRGYRFLGFLPVLAMHLGVLAIFWTGVTWPAVILCVALYVGRMFFVTGAYHRYFSHRTFKTSRAFQFVLAFLAETSLQKGVLWWAAHHRRHHRYSDTEKDVHSPKQRGLWYAQLGWLFDGTQKTDFSQVRDLAKYPELRWLNTYWIVPPLLGGAAILLLGGWSCLVVGGILGTVILWHGTFLVNSLAHVIGRRRFPTTDESKNSLFIALVTLGEGWHNNHHHYMHSTRQGFRWWEIDMTYYGLKLLSWVGLVWDLREPPPHMLVDAPQPAPAVAAAAEAAIILPQVGTAES